MSHNSDLYLTIGAAAPVLALGHFALMVPVVRQAEDVERASVRMTQRMLDELPHGKNPEPLFKVLTTRTRRHAKLRNRYLWVVTISLGGGLFAFLSFLYSVLSLKFERDYGEIWVTIVLAIVSFAAIPIGQVVLTRNQPSWDLRDELAKGAD